MVEVEPFTDVEESCTEGGSSEDVYKEGGSSEDIYKEGGSDAVAIGTRESGKKGGSKEGGTNWLVLGALTFDM